MDSEKDVKRGGRKRRDDVGKLAMAILGAALLLAPRLAAQEQKQPGHQDGFGFSVSKDVSAKEVGLPWYPGATLHHEKKDGKDDSSSVEMGLWGGSSDFQMAVLQLDSKDDPARVAAYYRKALSRYGKVLECRGESNAQEKSGGNKGSQALDCDSDKPENGGLVLKAGTKQEQHIASVEKEAGGSRIVLVYVRSKGKK